MMVLTLYQELNTNTCFFIPTTVNQRDLVNITMLNQGIEYHAISYLNNFRGFEMTTDINRRYPSVYCNNKQFNKSLKTNKGSTSISLQPLQHTAHCAKLQPQVKAHRPKRQCHHQRKLPFPSFIQE